MNPPTTEDKPDDFTPLAGLGGLPPRRPQPPPSTAPAASALQLVAPQPVHQPTVIFPCPYCHVPLTCHGTNLSGACPSCGNWIATTPRAPLPLVSTTSPQEAEAPSAPVATLEPANQDVEPASRRPELHRIPRTGRFNFRPLGYEDIPDRHPDLHWDNESSAPPPTILQAPAASANSLNRFRIQHGRKLIVVSAILLLATLIMTGIGWIGRDSKREQPAPLATSADELRAKMKQDALESLTAVFATEDPEEIAQHVIGGETMIPAIDERLKSDIPFPRLPAAGIADFVSDVTMEEQDLQRGFFGLLYQAPPDNTLSLDSPMLAAEKTMGVRGFDALDMLAVIDPTTKPVARQALALFAKRNERQLLDWDLFIQTWDRTLMRFSNGDLGPGPIRFRVVLSLDKPVFENGEFADQTIIRIRDPLFAEDAIRIAVSPYDQAVTALKPKPSAIEADPSLTMRPQTATVDLVRSENTGRVSIERFVCKEFLGLGGSEDNSGSSR